ncbi:ABC transporter permease [Chloroflexota bacterium]
MISPRWKKVIRDLWKNKTRTILVVLAIAVGVLAFGSVFITQEVLVSDMNTQYLGIKASTIVLRIPSFHNELVKWAQRQDEVADVQGRAVRTVKLLQEDKNHNFILTAYDDYKNTTMNIIYPEKGTWPPQRKELFVERASLPVIGAAVGDKVLIEMPNGRRRELTVAGTVHDLNALPANMFPEPSGYVSIETLEWLGLSNFYNQLEIVTTDEYRTTEQLETVADGLKNRLKHIDVTVNSYFVREPGEHWAKETTESFTLILSFMGFFSLVLSGFLVINTVTALLIEQRRQIGMMKAIGGTGKQIAGIYLTLVTCYGVLALFVALPVGMWLGYLFTDIVAKFLNIDIVNFHLPLSVLIMQIIASLVVPIVASAIPIYSGIRVTVSEAISSYGTKLNKRVGLIDRLLLRIRGLPRPVILSLRNTVRRKGRLLLTLCTLILAGTLFITVVNVRGSLITELDNILNAVFKYEVQLALDDKYPIQGVERRVERIPGVTGVEGWTGVQVQRIKADGTEGIPFTIIGLPPNTEFIEANIISGRWLKEGDRGVVVLTSSLLDDMPDLRTGDIINAKINDRKRELQVIGIAQWNFDKVGYADFDYISRIKGEPGMISSVRVSTEKKDGLSQTEMAEILEDKLKSSGIGVSYTITKNIITQANASQFDFLISFLLIMASLAALIGGLGLAGMMSLNVMERTREIGVIRSIGGSHGMIAGIVLTEGLLIGLFSWALALPFSIPMSLIFNSMLGDMIVDKPLIFIFSEIGVFGWLVIVIVVSVIASILPAYRAMSISIRETLAYE